MTQPTLFVFQNDLRLTDNPGLTAATQTDTPLVVCFVLDDQAGTRGIGDASRWWLHHSLTSLGQRLAELGGQLVLKSGPIETVVPELSKQINAGAVYWSRPYEPDKAKKETALKNALEAVDAAPKRFRGHLLFEPEQIRTKTDGPYKVFTPFWKACLAMPSPQSPLPVPKLRFLKNLPDSESLTDWQLLPSQPDWSGGLAETWTPGEHGAWQRLQTFLSNTIDQYHHGRDIPGTQGTSRLSPHLHFGEISPRQVWHAVQAACEPDTNPGAETFLKELGWREFSYHLLHHWPQLPERAFRPQFDNFPWLENPAHLEAWQKGQTGVPIVDAGMRELWHTGWMHNRVRMIVASFLTKNLLLPWQDGEAWFWDTLVDADLASNSAGWQWVAGCGADAAPYFRIFNPVTQSQKFDPNGKYLRKWIPEIAALDDKDLHAPWQASEMILGAAGVTLGQDYPLPLVDLKITRQRALDAYASIKAS